MENLIVKYLTDSITKEEEIKLREWLSSVENQEKFKEFVKDNHHLNFIYDDTIQVKDALKKIQKEIGPKKVKSLKSSYLSILKYAAILVIGVSFVFIYNLINSTSNITNTKNHVVLQLNDGTLLDLTSYASNDILNKKGELIASLFDEKLTYTTSKNTATSSNHKLSVPNSKTFTVVLSDNTEIMMNSGSTLKYTNTFSNVSTRDVSLEGEAYFNVAKNKELPFIVHTKNMNIRVLGTKFNVSSYQNDNISSVVLEEGSVGVNKPTETFDPKKSIILKSKQQLIFQKNQFLVQDVSIKKHTAWKKRQLHFSNDRFEDIVKELERYYDITITLSSSDLNDNRYTGTFTTETIIDVLDMFKELSEFNYTQNSNNNNITINNIKN